VSKARYVRDGSHLSTSMFEGAAWHYCIVVICRRCAHEAVFDRHGVWWLFHRNGWDGGLSGAARRFKCAKCGAGAFLTWDRTKEPTVELPMPDAREWKRALSRFGS
jgi:hypothetical protein